MIPAHRWTETSGASLLPTYNPDERREFQWPDGSVRVVIDNPEYDFHVDASAQAMAAVLKAIRAHMARIGFEPMSAEECPPELLDDGFVRVYYVPIESYGENGQYALPSVVETGFGPYSMEIPVISPQLIEDQVESIPDRELCEARTDALPIPPLPYGAPSTTRRYEQTTTGTVRRGRHRAPKK